MAGENGKVTPAREAQTRPLRLSRNPSAAAEAPATAGSGAYLHHGLGIQPEVEISKHKVGHFLESLVDDSGRREGDHVTATPGDQLLHQAPLPRTLPAPPDRRRGSLSTDAPSARARAVGKPQPVGGAAGAGEGPRPGNGALAGSTGLRTQGEGVCTLLPGGVGRE